jgi:hypothetical protein
MNTLYAGPFGNVLRDGETSIYDTYTARQPGGSSSLQSMQGFILGHLSTLVLLVAVLKLSLNPGPAQYVAERTPVLQSTHPATPIDWEPTHIEPESTEWLNALLHQVCKQYQPALVPLYVNSGLA